MNAQLFLLDGESTHLMTGDLNQLLDKNASLPDAYFFNSNNDGQYLRVIFHPGGSKNSISEFEVGFSGRIDTITTHPIALDHFQTESGIKIGMSINELIRIKGDHFNRTEVDEGQLISYVINDPKNAFLIRYNYPEYGAKYWFNSEGKLTKFWFGFPYP